MIGAKSIAAGVLDAVLSNVLNEVEPQLTRNGYDLRSFVEQFNAKPAEICRLLRGDLDAGRAQELMDKCASPNWQRDRNRLSGGWQD